MCFLYDLHEYIDIFKKNNNIKNDISNDIDYIEDNIIELYYKNKFYNINEQVKTILTPLILENKYNQ
jgi:NAD(P)H-nitrite reductase large subunit